MIAVLKQKLHAFISDQRFSEVLTGSAYALGAKVVATVLAMVSTIVVVRYYGAEMMGILAMVNASLMFATMFSVVGTTTSVLRFIPEHTTKYSVSSAYHVYRKIQYFVVAMALAIGTLLFLGSGFVAGRLFAKPHLGVLFAMAAVVVVFHALADFNTQAARGLKLVRAFAFMQVIPAGAMLTILLALTFLSFHLYNPIYAQLAAWMVTALIGVLIVGFVFKQRMQPGDELHAEPLGKVLSISFPMLMTASMHFAIGQMGVIFLGMFQSTSDVGYYSVALRMSMLTVFALQAINSIAAPTFAQLYHAGKMEELFYIAKKAARLTFWTTTPVLFVLVVFGRPLLRALFGVEFESAYWPMTLLIAGQLFSGMSGSTGYFMNMTGHQKAFRNIVVVSAVTNIVLNLALIPSLGVTGAAGAGMVSLILWNGLTVLYIRRQYGNTIGYFPFVRWG